MLNKFFIRLLIFSMSLALIGLIAIQLYWMNNAVSLKEARFAQDVNSALRKVVEKLEKRETLEKLKSHQTGRFLFFGADSTGNSWEHLADTSFKYFVMKDVQKSGDEIQIKITEEQNGQLVTKTISKNLSKGDTVTEKELYEPGLKFAPDTISTEESEMLMQSRLTNKTAFVGDIVKSLIQVNLFEKMENRLSKELLDSLLTEELQNEGISAEYEFGVFGPQEKLLLAKTYNDTAGLQKTDLQLRLFPNDIIENPHFLKIYFPSRKSYLMQTLWLILLASALLMASVIFVFSYTIVTIIRQKKLAEVKNDFINNMTHELKTPVSTISLACEALKDPKMNKNANFFSRYVSMIEDENKRLGAMVQNVLQSAIWDKADFELKKEKTDVHEIIRNAVEKTEILAKGKNGKIEMNLNAIQHFVSADKVHFTNVIFNLIDNALKYTLENPLIIISTKNENNGMLISVQDNGIGISKEEQKKIFEKLYRVPTGNIHNVKGFGLGLNYVKTIVEKHGGTVSVESEIGKGSCFRVRLPEQNI